MNIEPRLALLKVAHKQTNYKITFNVPVCILIPSSIGSVTHTFLA